MNATIFVREQTVRCHIGCTEAERRVAQDIVVDVECETDIAAAMRSDDLADALDYAAVHADVARIAESRTFALLEAFAASIIQGCLARPNVQRVRVRIEKPYKLASCRAVGLHVEAARPV